MFSGLCNYSRRQYEKYFGLNNILFTVFFFYNIMIYTYIHTIFLGFDGKR